MAQKKCVVMRVGNMFPAHVYNLNGHTLPIQSSFKDLGITFSDKNSENILLFLRGNHELYLKISSFKI